MEINKLYVEYNFPHRIPPEVRVEGYQGPTELAIELSEYDKKYIVKFYSKGKKSFP